MESNKYKYNFVQNQNWEQLCTNTTSSPYNFKQFYKQICTKSKNWYHNLSNTISTLTISYDLKHNFSSFAYCKKVSNKLDIKIKMLNKYKYKKFENENCL